MPWLDRDELTRLIHADDAPCVSAYMPTHPGGPEVRQNPIRLKNAVAQARQGLHQEGVAEEDADALLAPWEELVGDDSFWRHQALGLALFVAPGLEQRYRVPVEVPERVVVGERFHVKPLLPLLGNGRFFVLALSRGQVRLLEATRHQVREMDAEDLPEELRDVVGYDWDEQSLQFHSVTPRGGGGIKDAVHHGQSRSKDHGHAETVRFLEQVENGITGTLQASRAPLVVATVEDLFGEYRKVNRYAHLVDEPVLGNPDELDAEALHRKALEVVEPRFGEARREAAALFAELHGTGRASADPRVVVQAACDGRVASLFVARGAARWGRVDVERRQVEELPAGQGEDLLDRAAAETVVHDGDVWLVEPDDLPVDDGHVAAVFRY